jgi:hypothetical protein
LTDSSIRSLMQVGNYSLRASDSLSFCISLKPVGFC